MKFQYMHPADQLVMMMNRIYYKGLTTTSGGNLSVMDTEGNIWITPSGVDKGKLCREDIVKVLPSGEKIGRHSPSVELPFHRAVMQTTGARAVLHAHPPALVSVSLLRAAPNIRMLPHYARLIKKLGISAYDIPGSAELGEKISKVFAEGCDAVMMENHGIVVCAEDIFQAFVKFEAMETAARLTMEVQTLGKPKVLTGKQMKALDGIKCSYRDADLSTATPLEADLRNRIADFSRRSARQNLFASFDGVYAARLEADSFLVMPDSVDREYLEAEDVVKVRGRGAKQKGQKPSRYTEIIAEVFRRKPNVGAVAVASPVHAMAFGATGTELDSKTIPESYLMMRAVNRLTYEEFLASPLRVAELLDENHPVVLVENALVFTAGVNLTKSFDSLEVCDFTAKTILQSMRMAKLGPIVKISEQEVEEFKAAFHLE